MRGDDGAGLEAARILATSPPRGVRIVELETPLDLLDIWTPDDHVLLIDAVRCGLAPGTVVATDPCQGRSAALFRGSTHALGVIDAIELARALRRLPAGIRLYGIEAASFAAGAELSPAVRRAARALAAQLRRQLS